MHGCLETSSPREAQTGRSDARPENRLKRRAAAASTLLFAVLVFWSCFDNAWTFNRHWFAPHAALSSFEQYALNDTDQHLFMDQSSRLPSFWDSLKLWGRTVPSDNVYWRPLLMWTFWAQYRLFGGAPAGYIACLILAHMVYLAAMCAGLRTVTRSWAIGLLGILIFAGSRAVFPMTLVNAALRWDPLWTAGAGSNVALYFWKDQNEMWSGALFWGALIASSRQRWYLTTFLFVVGVMEKEYAWAVPVFVALLAASEGRLRRIPRAAWIAMAASSALLALVRVEVGLAVATHHISHNVLHNLSLGIMRYLRLVAGRGLLAFTAVSWAAPAIGGGLGIAAALCALRRARPAPAFSVWLLAGIVAAAVWAHVQQLPVVVAATSLILPECDLPRLVGEFLYAFCVVCVAFDRDAAKPLALFALAALLDGLPALLGCRESEHIGYLTNSFQASMVAFVCVWMARRAWRMAAPAVAWIERRERPELAVSPQAR